MSVTAADGRAAFESFLALSHAAVERGSELAARYRREGKDSFATLVDGQVEWIEQGRDLVLSGRLLPGGDTAFSGRRMFADFGNHPDGGAFEAAVGALEDYWRKERLGLPDWNWQAGLPPGWLQQP